MDVRCEKCNTEYELDDAKVTEIGVTVKCTTCGNLFKVRRRASTATGAQPGQAPAGDTHKGLPPAPAAGRPPRAPTAPPPVPADAGAKAPAAGGWMLRLGSSTVQRFRELTTLQQWIVERKVTRDHEISRTGESWKRLGDIAELAAFFMVVDQADAASKAAAAAGAAERRRQTQPFAPTGQTPGTPSQEMAAQAGKTVPISVAPPPTPPAGRPRPPTVQPPPVPAAATPPAEEPTGPTVAAMAAAAAGVPTAAMTTLRGHDSHSTPRPAPPPSAPQSFAPPAGAAPGDADGPSQGGVRSPTADGEPQGPTGGLRGAPVLDPSWAGSADAVRRSREQMHAGESEGLGPALLTGKPIGPQLQMPEVFDPIDADEELPAPPSRWPWVAATLFVIMLGGAAAVYFLVFAKKQGPPAVAGDPGTAPDAAVVAEAAAPDAAPPPPAAAASLADGWARYWAASDADLEAAEKLFEAARAADPVADAQALAGLSLVNAALAQGLGDDADDVAAADARRAEQLRAEARRRAERAGRFAKESLAKAPTTEGALAQAEARRLARAPVAEVDKILAASEGTKGKPDAQYSKGMARLGHGKAEDARKLLEIAAADHRATAGGEHVRARLALARLARAQKRWDDARREVGAVLAVAPDHPRAKALAERIATESGAPLVAGDGPPDAGAVAVNPPGGGGGGADRPPGGGGDVPPTGAIGADAYDGLVAKGNARAENGDCKTAMQYFEKALDARPGGVEALVGLGYCHMDRKEFARAQANFRAALGISPRFGDAIIGLAEAYRFQGQNAQAIEFYQRYLDSHPGGAKAEMARRQIKALSGSAAPPPGGGGGETPPDPPPEPAPEPPKPPPADPPPGGETVPDEG